ncbi:unnamed protein product [Dicrocoelium dendriticum]|nr:unnamed protein product [Dicrocoelium dendriticum]
MRVSLVWLYVRKYDTGGAIITTTRSNPAATAGCASTRTQTDIVIPRKHRVLFQGWSLPFCESLWGQMSRVPDQPTTTTDHPITLPPALEMGTLYAVLIFVFLILFMYLISR